MKESKVSGADTLVAWKRRTKGGKSDVYDPFYRNCNRNTSRFIKDMVEGKHLKATPNDNGGTAVNLLGGDAISDYFDSQDNGSEEEFLHDYITGGDDESPDDSAMKDCEK